MAAPRLRVYELDIKINYLMGQRKWGRTEFCKETGIHEHSLRRAIGNSGEQSAPGKFSRIGRLDLQRIGKTFGFPACDDVDRDGRILEEVWPEWMDTSRAGVERRDSAQSFIERYRRVYGSGANAEARASLNLKSPRISATGRSEEGTAAPVRLGPGTAEPVKNLTKTIRLASVAVEGQQWGQGSVALFLSLACNKWRSITVLRGRLLINAFPGTMTTGSYAQWDACKAVPCNVSGRRSTVLIERGGTRHDPHFDVAGLEGPIGAVSIDEDLPVLEGLSPGDSITVTFGTWLADVDAGVNKRCEGEEIDDFSGSDGLGLLDVSGQLVGGSSKELEPFKKLAISLIRQSALDAGPDGFVELSSHTLKIGKAV